jgi:hypothetical protein
VEIASFTPRNFAHVSGVTPPPHSLPQLKIQKYYYTILLQFFGINEKFILLGMHNYHKDRELGIKVGREGEREGGNL